MPKALPEHLPEYADLVLSVAELIPAGRVLAYGDIAQLLCRGGPRQVGAVLSTWGSAVPWWRVIRADGTLPEHLTDAAAKHYRSERTPLRTRGGVRGVVVVDMAQARWEPDDAAVSTIAELMSLTMPEHTACRLDP